MGDTQPNNYLLANFALIIAQVSFGIGSVVGAIGLPATNPVLFALVREGIAGPILCVMAWWELRKAPLALSKHFKRLFVCGIAIFGNQFCAITGIKLAGGVTMAVWQPTQPIFSLSLAILLKYEKFSWMKAAGILIAFLGVAFMVLFDAESQSDSSVGKVIGGNVMFFINCFSTSSYVIVSKPLLKELPSIAVTGISYMIASLFMAIACVIVNSSTTLLAFVCPRDNGEISCGNGWQIPTETIWALAYWIVFSSIIAYCMMTWANRFVDASLVSVYTVLQPVTAAVMTAIIIKVTHPPHFGLKGAGIGDIGAVGIFAGLGMVVYDSRRARKQQELSDSATKSLLKGTSAAEPETP